ncbi:hypothetical protein ACIQ7Q_13705 [Streptomyces sp. NPDC096176]|uniref:hypothetical protein n=1 Tax=Streptomyces sp. NPDC096176 TaxID=3366079 RepID=UPI0037F2DF06
MDLEKPSQTPADQRYGAPVAPRDYEPGDGCLAEVIRIPVRIVVVLVVLPVRMLWDVLMICGRAVQNVLLRPLGRAIGWFFERVVAPIALGVAWLAGLIGKLLFVWPWVGLWRYVVVPVVKYGLVVPVVWVYRQLLTPLGHGIAWLVEHLLVAPARWTYRALLAPLGHGIAVVLSWLGKALFVWPWVALWLYVVVPVVKYGLVVPAVWVYRQLLTPLGHGIAWLARGIGYGITTVLRGLWAATVWLVTTLLVTPAAWLYRYVLAPCGREITAAVGIAWRVAGYISRAVGRGLKWLARNLVGRPARWFYLDVLTPVGHFVRDTVWRPARKAAVETGRATRAALHRAGETVRQARRDVWRALGGTPREPRSVAGFGGQARNLGGGQQTQTVPGVAAEPEISLHKRG